MEDPSFLYQDPYDTPFSPSFFNMCNPTLADLSNNNINNNNDGPTTLPQQNHQQGSTNEPFSDPMVQDHQFVHSDNFSFGREHFEVGGPSQMHGNGQSQPANENVTNHSEVLTFAEWPPTPLPFFCSCCQVLREIIHTNGTCFEKLEIHGRLGLISHAIHRQNINNGDSSINPQYQMVDFCRRSIDEVKTFLEQYCMQRSAGGYFIMQDPLSTYYEALCTGLDWAEDFNDDPENQNLEGIQVDGMEPDAVMAAKISLSIQRERSGKMNLSHLSDYFHLPIEEAAKFVNLCPTVVKKVCRKEGLSRWPHRKVKSILKQISLLESTLDPQDAASRARTDAEISRLKQEMIHHCGGVAPTAIPNFTL